MPISSDAESCSPSGQSRFYISSSDKKLINRVLYFAGGEPDETLSVPATKKARVSTTKSIDKDASSEKGARRRTKKAAE
jgi:hypothetical protein